MNIHLSHWETDSWVGSCDYLIVGSGIVGLSAALRLRELNPDAEIRVVERGALPTGASTKNAGFTCFGSLSELQDDLQHSSKDEILALVDQRWKGLQKLRNRIGDKCLRYESVGGYELFGSKDQASYRHCIDAMEQWNRDLRPVIGIDEVFRKTDEKIGDFGFSGVESLIQNTQEGLIDTGRMMRELLRQVQAAGVLLLTGAEVVAIEPAPNEVRVRTANGWELRARQVIVATNGFARRLMPELSVAPARAQVLVTEPIEGLAFKGGFHLDRGYYYFRHLNGRVLFGGGRNLDVAGESTDTIALTDLIQNELERLLKQVILPGKDFEIAHRWAGIMGVGESKSTILKNIGARITCAVRLGGMGVAIGMQVGEDAADMVGEL